MKLWNFVQPIYRRVPEMMKLLLRNFAIFAAITIDGLGSRKLRPFCINQLTPYTPLIGSPT